MKEKRYCSFCGKPEDLVRKLITGQNGACICDECLEIGHDMIKEEGGDKFTPVPLKKPAEIKKADIPDEIEKLKGLMKAASAQLDFERAIEIRERIAELRKQLRQ